MTPHCLMIERSVREGCIPSCCRELDSECRAFAYFRFLHVYPASVIFLHNPFGKCEPQSPASFFCGVSGIEYCLEILSGNPFAGISDFYPHDIFFGPRGYVESAFPLHGVNSIFCQILHHPFYQRARQLHPVVINREMYADVHSSGYAALHIVERFRHHFVQIIKLNLRLGAYF